MRSALGHLLLFFSLLWPGLVLGQGSESERTESEQHAFSPLGYSQASADHLIRSHRPVYFAYGRPLTKIQFSFRSQLSEAVPVNFAYSQLIFWQLHRASKPFLDATYNPEVFIRLPWGGPRWRAFDFGLWEHNSNGKGGLESRSFDQTYFRAAYGLEWQEWGLVLSTKLKYIYNRDRTNPDIRNYIGPVDFEVRVLGLLDSVLDKTEIIFSLQPGGKFATDWGRGGYQVSVNFHVRGLHMNPAFYLQYYHGYAETLINYKQKVDSFRAGLMF